MSVVGIEHADADAQAARCGCAGRRRRQDAALEGVLGKPDAMETACIRDPREIDTATGIDPAVKAHAEFR
jgi:hypothetical protein